MRRRLPDTSRENECGSKPLVPRTSCSSTFLNGPFFCRYSMIRAAVASAPAAFRVRVWAVMSRGWGPPTGRPLPEAHGPQGNPVQFPDSHSIPISIPVEFPRIDVSGRTLWDKMSLTRRFRRRLPRRRGESISVVAGPRNHERRGVSGRSSR